MTTGLPPAQFFSALIGNSQGNTVQIPAAAIVATIASLIGPPKETRNALYADLAWPAGAVGTVWKDADDANLGTYLKFGNTGGGGWSRIGALPTTSLAQAQLDGVVNLLLDEIGALSAGMRYVGEWAPSSGAFPAGSSAGDTWVVTTAGNFGGKTWAEGDRLISVKNGASTTVYAANWIKAAHPVPATPEKVFSTIAAAVANPGSLAAFSTVKTLGRAAAGDGGGATYLRTLSAIRGGFQDQQNQRWRPTMDTPIRPETFGDCSGDPAHDDAPAIIEMINAIKDFGAGTGVFGAGKQYYLASTLMVDPTRVTLAGMGNSILDWRLKTFTNPAAMSQKVTNGAFGSGSGWTQSGNSTVPITYSGGMARWAMTLSTLQYAEFGQQIALTAGKRYRVRLTVGEIQTRTIGANTYRSVSVSFRNLGIGNGSSGGSLREASNVAAAYAGGVFEWIVVCPYDNPYLTIQSNTVATIDEIDIREVASNEMIYIETPANGNLRLHNLNMLERLKLQGTLDAGLQPFVKGIFFDTATAGLSSRSILRQLDINTGVGIGMEFFNRAYLIGIEHCRVVASEVCFHTIGNASDAGENIHIIGGNCGGSKIGIANRGNFDLRLFGHSIDFARQWIVTEAGGVELFGCHLENGVFDSDQTATNDHYRIDISGGEVTIQGGYVLNGGSPAGLTNALAPFRVNKPGLLVINEARYYGLTGSLGKVAIGDGMVRMNHCRNTAGASAGIISDAMSEVLPVEGDVLPVLAFVSPGAANGTVAMSADQHRSGTKSIKLQKTGVGGGSAVSGNFAFPIERFSQVGFEAWWKVPPIAGSTVVFDIYAQTHFAQIVFNNGQQQIVKLEQISDFVLRDIDAVVGTDWASLRSSSQRVDLTSPHMGYAPAWATHALWQISLFNAPNGTAFYLDDLKFNQL